MTPSDVPEAVVERRRARVWRGVRGGVGEAGTTAAEYLGVIVLVAALVAALGLTPIGQQVSGGLRQAICSIVGGGACDAVGAAGAHGAAGQGSDGSSESLGVTGVAGCSGVWCSVRGAAGTFWSGTTSVAGGVWSGAKGLGSAAWGDVTGVWDLVTDPSLIVDAGSAIWDDPFGVAGQVFWDQESRDAWAGGDRANAVGRTIWNVGSIVVGVTKVGKAGKVGAVGSSGGVAEEVAGLAVDARRAADAASDAARVGDAAAAASPAAEARRLADEALERAARLGCPVAAPPLGRLGGGGGRGLIAMAAPAAPILAAGPCDEAGDAARQADQAADAAEAASKSTGSFKTIGSGFSASEQAAAQTLAARGHDVVLREATGVGRTSDLLVDGIPYDVYTPTTGNLDRIVGAIASKGSQVDGGGVVLDLSRSPLTGVDRAVLLARVQGITDKVNDIIILGD